jgi:MoaA/NifB/PqqE/SkfB family radical SAM enzyme/glycosyltransferase involved in cell wall biosynthesis
MRLSVIVPVRNGAAFVGVLLDSLHMQDMAAPVECEFIVVDDASTDATPALLSRYPWLRVIRHETRRGAGAARNSGARQASGDVLVFLDADTRVREPGFLQRCAGFFAGHPDYDAVSGCYYDVNPVTHLFTRYLDLAEAAMRDGALDRDAPGSLSGCVCAVRKAVFDESGGFSEDPRVALEDPDLGCRLAEAGHRHWLSSDLRVEHRQPGLWHYAKELVPRTRYYMHMIRHYGVYNEGMGGRHEGLARALYVLGWALLAIALLVPLAVLPGALLLGIAGWLARPMLHKLRRAEGIAFLPLAMFFHGVTSVAVVAGGVLGLWDALRDKMRRGLIDCAVLAAYLKSLLAKQGKGYLIHFLTHRCNARCGHCFDSPQRLAIVQRQELDLSRIRRLAASVGPVGHLSLTGGEPLLRDDIAEIVAAYYEAGVRSFSLSSNGSYPERLAALLPQMAAAAPFGRIIVTISVDGIGARHDKLRGLPGLYAKVERSLAVLRQARQWLPQIKAHACITLTSDNAGHIDEILVRLRRLRLDQVEMTRLRGVPADPSVRGVDDATFDAASASIAAANGAARGLAQLFSRLDRAMFTIVHQPDRPWPCGGCLAGRRLAVIQADGTVLPCEMLRSMRPHDAPAYDNFALGRLDAFGDDLGALLASPQAQRITGYIRKTDCRCSFECAIFATIAYRPWRLWRFLSSRPADESGAIT